MRVLAWFESLSVLEQIFFYIALPSTIILFIQTIMLFFGDMGHGQGDMDMDSDTSGLDIETGEVHFESAGDVLSSDLDDVTDSDSGSLDSYGLRFFTVRGIIAFLTVAGWTGICCLEFGGNQGLSILISVIFGAAAMIGIAYLVRALMGLQINTNIDYKNALGLVGDVYLTIPANGHGSGKVSLPLGGALSQYDAITHERNVIKTGELVRVTDIVTGSIMVVERESDGAV
ncbi:MAG: hypothetical protein LBL09_04840 [Oscillospiraceae bacterium]|jgi:hypothetical protein|nr:hypothetical protein [Oscillospiraceae bacterium]